MASVPQNVSLNDRVMGKRGRYYTCAEINALLGQYRVRPRNSYKLHLFRQLYELAARENLRTAHQRKELLRGHTDSPIHPLQSQTAVITREKLCSICAEQKLANMFPVQMITTQCTHKTEVCTECLQRCIESQLEYKTWNTLECPLCRQRLPFEAVRDHSSTECFEKYDRQVTMHAIKDIPNFCMCLGPTCGSGQIHCSGDEKPIMTCNSCGFKTCYTHQMPWHSEVTCKEYDDANALRLKQNRASVRLIQKRGKVCPNCSVPGIKVSGCDHMTCPRCAHEYCAECFASYKMIRKKGNSAHRVTCPYHSGRLPQLDVAVLD